MAIPDGTLPVDDVVQHEAFMAELAHFYVREKMTDYPGMAANTKLQIFRHVVEGMIATMTTWCVTGRVESTKEVKVIEWPDGVWQTFKAKYLPYWFTQKFPVRHIRREIVQTVNHYFVCPHLAVDPQRKHIQFMATGTRLAGRIHSDG